MATDLEWYARNKTIVIVYFRMCQNLGYALRTVTVRGPTPTSVARTDGGRDGHHPSNTVLCTAVHGVGRL